MVTCMNKERKYGSVNFQRKSTRQIVIIQVTGVPEEVSKDIAQRAYDDCLVKSNLSKELVFEPLGEQTQQEIKTTANRTK